MRGMTRKTMIQQLYGQISSYKHQMNRLQEQNKKYQEKLTVLQQKNKRQKLKIKEQTQIISNYRKNPTQEKTP